MQHDFHQDPTHNADLVVRSYACYGQRGLFGDAEPALFGDGFEVPSAT